MFQTGRLDNGIVVVMEKIPYVKSVSFGCWVKCGSVNETPRESGISHFIEHMVFKGTQKRTAAQIAQEMDNIGGQMNAFTAKETTCFYTKTLDNHLDISVDLLCDMLFHSKFSEKEIETEKNVVLEEINMIEDTPDELVFDLMAETAWKGHPLSQPILGTPKTVASFHRAMLCDYMKRHYTARTMVLAVAGNIQFQQTMDLLNATFGREKIEVGKTEAAKSLPFYRQVRVKKKDMEQTHLCISFQSLKSNADEVYDLAVANAVFGGAMGSRLFQKIREELGLVYSIYSFPSHYESGGLFHIYAATNPRNVKKVMQMVADEVELLRREKITAEDVQKAKEQLKCSYILGMESCSSRMSSIGKSMLLYGRIRTQEEILEKCDAVTKESVDRIIDQVFQRENVAVCVVGASPKSIDYLGFFETE